jgi:flagellar basal-body rod protein FlgF
MPSMISASPVTSNYLLTGNMITLKERIQINANNIANGATTSFKQDIPVVKGQPVPVGMGGIFFATDGGTFRDTTPGVPRITENPLDVALASSGYLSVQGPNGQVYTRDGQFSINADTGNLVTLQGMPVLDEGGGEIPIESEISIAIDGTITDSEKNFVAKLGVFDFEDEQIMMKIGDNLYETEQEPIPSERPQVLQGYIEDSNVSTALAMVDLQSALAAYQQEAALMRENNESELESISLLVAM